MVIATVMHPLPTRPVESTRLPGSPTPLPVPTPGRMHPLGVNASYRDALAAIDASHGLGLSPRITPAA
ncbi:MAG: hypothetical protein JWO69_1333 [Thermoleophilia bacterium]|nr:hypothetical protein [Thermoleophilia bacterium]